LGRDGSHASGGKQTPRLGGSHVGRVVGLNRPALQFTMGQAQFSVSNIFLIFQTIPDFENTKAKLPMLQHLSNFA
jgi:hypothetical protein